MSFAKADSSRRIRAALLRKAVPLRGPYSPGDLVCFHRRNRWHDLRELWEKKEDPHFGSYMLEFQLLWQKVRSGLQQPLKSW